MPERTASTDSAARDQRRKLPFQAPGLLERGDPGLAHRSGQRARLFLGPGNVLEQHADIDPRRVGRNLQRLGLAVERRALLGEIMGDPAEAV